MAELSAEPVAVGCNGYAVRLGSRVTYLGAVFAVDEIGPCERYPDYTFLTLAPTDEQSRSKTADVPMGSRQILPDGRIKVFPNDVRLVGTPDVYIPA